MASFSLTGFCQGFINFENVASATLKDKDGNKYGTGDLQRINGRVSFPLSRSLNVRNLPTASLQVFEKASIYAGAGGVWKRSSRITDRDMNSFFKKINDDTGRYYRM